VGSLDQIPLAEVFQRIVRKGRSGDLQVTIPGAVKTVYFDRGFVVFAASDLTSDRLGESLIEAGRISRHEFALASMVMKASKRKFGETLVEAGIVSEEELGQHVASQVNRIVLSLFSAKSGTYGFDEHSCSIPVGLMVSLSIYRILLEGVRRMTSQRLVLAGLPSLDTRLRIAPEPPFTLDVQKLRPEEKQVLRSAGTGASIAQIVETVGGHKGMALRAAYALLSAGLLESVAAETPTRARLRVQEETGTFVLSEIRQKVEAKTEAPAPVPLDPKTETPVAEPVVEPVAEPAAEPVGKLEAPRLAQDRTPVHAAVTSPVRAADVQESSPPFLSRLRELAKRIWLRIEKALLHWVGSSAAETAEALHEMHGPPEPQRPRPEAKASRPAPPPKREAVPSVPRERAPVPAPVHEEVEGVGIPSWSILAAPEEDAGNPSKPEGMDLEVGVPSWSMKDAPGEVEPEEHGLTARAVGVPSWSMMDDPEQSKEGPPVRRETRSAKPPRETVKAIEPLSSLDHELFIEGELPGEDEPSLLQHIPVEEITLGEEALEVEGGVFAELAEVEHPAQPAEEAAPPAPPVNESRPPASDASEGPAVRPETGRGAAGTQESSRDEVAASSREEEMRRMRQGGGESRLLRDVKLHFKLQDWEGAVPLLEQLLQISPGSALYRGMLARAMSRHPVRRKEAEEHFIEALRLAPQDAELHYWLGLYYKSFGLKARAYTEFRTTLRIDPKHGGARKQLSGERKDDAVGAVIKKLFG
jgi:hypothetical protein